WVVVRIKPPIAHRHARNDRFKEPARLSHSSHDLCLIKAPAVFPDAKIGESPNCANDHRNRQGSREKMNISPQSAKRLSPPRHIYRSPTRKELEAAREALARAAQRA